MMFHSLLDRACRYHAIKAFTKPFMISEPTMKFAMDYQVGIIGRTGAGKSSVLNALFRLVPICNGHILVDGIDVAKVAVRELRAHFAVVPQSPFLFDGSLRFVLVAHISVSPG